MQLWVLLCRTVHQIPSTIAEEGQEEEEEEDKDDKEESVIILFL